LGNWGLTGDGAVDKIGFSEKDWFDFALVGQPQITVSHLNDLPGRFLSNPGGTLLLHSYPKFVVNCWVPIASGAAGTDEAELIEAMRFEVCRIVLANRNGIADFKPIVPVDEGLPLHEITANPRILRYEITLVGAHDKTKG
jgi:hypothetical protein